MLLKNKKTRQNSDSNFVINEKGLLCLRFEGEEREVVSLMCYGSDLFVFKLKVYE